MSSDRINDSDMDHFGSGTDILSTTGVGPCISFLVILDHGQHVFVEHRGPTNIPSIINFNTVRVCLENVAKHVYGLLPISSITAVFILGRVNSDQNYINLQKEIHKILQSDVDYGDINQSSFYKDLLKNIKYHDVCFHFGSENPQKTGECNVDVIVGRYIKEDNPTIYMVANVTKFAVYNVTVGVTSLKTGNTHNFC